MKVSVFKYESNFDGKNDLISSEKLNYLLKCVWIMIPDYVNKH